MKTNTSHEPALESPSGWQIMLWCAIAALLATCFAHAQPAAVESTAVVGVVTPKVEVTSATSDGVKKASARQAPDQNKPWTLVLEGDSNRTVEKMKALAASVIDGKSSAFVPPVIRVTVPANYYQAYILVPNMDEEFVIRVDVDSKNSPHKFSISTGRRGTSPSERLEVSDIGLRGQTISGKLPEAMVTRLVGGSNEPAILRNYLFNCVCACSAVVVAADKEPLTARK